MKTTPPAKKPSANSAKPSSKATPSSGAGGSNPANKPPGSVPNYTPQGGMLAGGGGGAGQIQMHNIKGVGLVQAQGGAGGSAIGGGASGSYGNAQSVGTSPVTPDTFMAYRVCLMMLQDIVYEAGISSETWDQLLDVTNHTEGDRYELPKQFAVPPVPHRMSHPVTEPITTAVRTFASRARLLLLRIAGRRRPADH
jgi:hypothetical protein